MLSVEGLYTTISIYLHLCDDNDIGVVMMVATLFTMTKITWNVSAFSGARSKTPKVASMPPVTFLPLLLGLFHRFPMRRGSSAIILTLLHK